MKRFLTGPGGSSKKAKDEAPEPTFVIAPGAGGKLPQDGALEVWSPALVFADAVRALLVCTGFSLLAPPHSMHPTPPPTGAAGDPRSRDPGEERRGLQIRGHAGGHGLQESAVPQPPLPARGHRQGRQEGGPHLPGGAELRVSPRRALAGQEQRGMRAGVRGRQRHTEIDRRQTRRDRHGETDTERQTRRIRDRKNPSDSYPHPQPPPLNPLSALPPSRPPPPPPPPSIQGPRPPVGAGAVAGSSHVR